MSDAMLKLIEKLDIKGDWITNTDPAHITATPDGKGYTVLGSVYPNAVLGRPSIPPHSPNLLTTVEDMEQEGTVGLYKPFSFAEESKRLTFVQANMLRPLSIDEPLPFKNYSKINPPLDLHPDKKINHEDLGALLRDTVIFKVPKP